MKSSFFLLLLLSVIFTSCKDDDTNPEPIADLHVKWEIYKTGLIVFEDKDACTYKVKASDMYEIRDRLVCRNDYLYDFSHSQNLIIHSGNPKCSNDPATSVSKAYEKRGEKLSIESEEYSIVMLTRDTLILEHCIELLSPTYDIVNNKGKEVLKFVRHK